VIHVYSLFRLLWYLMYSGIWMISDIIHIPLYIAHSHSSAYQVVNQCIRGVTPAIIWRACARVSWRYAVHSLAASHLLPCVFWRRLVRSPPPLCHIIARKMTRGVSECWTDNTAWECNCVIFRSLHYSRFISSFSWFRIYHFIFIFCISCPRRVSEIRFLRQFSTIWWY